MRNSELIITIIIISQNWQASSPWRMASLLPEMRTPMGHHHSRWIIILGDSQSSKERKQCWSSPSVSLLLFPLLMPPVAVPPLAGWWPSLALQLSALGPLWFSVVLLPGSKAAKLRNLGSLEAFRASFTPSPLSDHLYKDLESNFQDSYLCNWTVAATASPHHFILLSHQFSFPPKNLLQVIVQRQYCV